MKSRARHLTAYGLLAVNMLLLLAGIGAWRNGERHVHEPSALTSQPPAPIDLTPLDSLSVPGVDVTILREQALFHASRAFYHPADKSADVPPPEYDFSGTLRLSNGARLAFVKKPASQSSRTLHVGDDLDGWRVRSIEADHLVLDHDGQSAELAAPRKNSSLGLVHITPTPHLVTNGPRVLSGSTPSTGPGASTGARRSRMYTPPPQ